MQAKDNIIVEDNFQIVEIDGEGKYFEKGIG